MRRSIRTAVLILLVLFQTSAHAAKSADPLEAGFQSPPPEARSRVFWWWANGNVTKAAITRDLEEMKAKGIGGALIFDAGGAGTGSAGPIPAGPMFGSPEWVSLFRHALAEAKRNGIEISLNIQSGWNLGGPDVKPEEAAKQVTWAETTIKGGQDVELELPRPASGRDGFYRDIAVLAWPLRKSNAPIPQMRASSYVTEYPPELVCDGQSGTFWVSRGAAPGDGPGPGRVEWLEMSFSRPVIVNGLQITPRPQYGPRECTLQVLVADQAWRPVASFKMAPRNGSRVEFAPVEGKVFRLTIPAAYDRGSAQKPRNVQVAEWRLLGPELAAPHPPIQNLANKIASREVGGSNPETAYLLDDESPVTDEEDARLAQVVNLTDRVKGSKLSWQAPAGTWALVRFGYTTTPAHVSTASPTWSGRVVDYMDAGALRGYWRRNVEPLIAAAGPLAGTVWKYVHTDSWELGGINWSASFPEEFRRRRGYDPIPWLAVLAGKIIENRSASNRFLNDFRKTIGECIADNHYGVLTELAAAHGMGTHPESGGPHGAPIDALQCLGHNTVPMMEFWSKAPTHRTTEESRFFVKQAAAAAHIYGKPLVTAEAFTNIGPHWAESPDDNLKPSFDHAAAEGLNRATICLMTCAPPETGLPGQEIWAGLHFNPNITWWKESGAFLAYMNRCHFLLQQGHFVADAVYYYGDWVPNFVRLKREDPAGVMPGRDYDVCNEEVLLMRMSVRDGRIVLPDGISYRVLVLPDRTNISAAALKKIAELVRGGATVVGPRPSRATGLAGWPECDASIRNLAGELWGSTGSDSNGKAGHIRADETAHQALARLGVPPDLEWTQLPPGAEDTTTSSLDWIHRRMDQTDIYFLANPAGERRELRCTFRATGRRPELWDPVSGTIRDLPDYTVAAGRTSIPLRFEPYQSFFVIFRFAENLKLNVQGQTSNANRNFPELQQVCEIGGAWDVAFDPKWGGPETMRFEELYDWSRCEIAGIKYYSGTATYKKIFDLPNSAFQGRRPSEPSRPHSIWYLDLGKVKNLARVRLNGKDLGVVWTAPWRVEITGVIREKDNRLEIDVVNLWPNRLIGDAAQPPEKRLTRTNITGFYKSDSPLLPSGLLGPVTLQLEP